MLTQPLITAHLFGCGIFNLCPKWGVCFPTGTLQCLLCLSRSLLLCKQYNWSHFIWAEWIPSATPLTHRHIPAMARGILHVCPHSVTRWETGSQICRERGLLLKGTQIFRFPLLSFIERFLGGYGESNLQSCAHHAGAYTAELNSPALLHQILSGNCNNTFNQLWWRWSMLQIERRITDFRIVSDGSLGHFYDWTVIF